MEFFKPIFLSCKVIHVSILSYKMGSCQTKVQVHAAVETHPEVNVSVFTYEGKTVKYVEYKNNNGQRILGVVDKNNQFMRWHVDGTMVALRDETGRMQVLDEVSFKASVADFMKLFSNL